MAEAEAPEVEEEEEECPKCPPVGAPAWMATFADMATLLWPSLFLFFPLLNLMCQNLNKFLARCEMPSGYKKCTYC